MDQARQGTAAMIDSMGLLARLQLLWRLLRDDRVSPWLKRLGPMGALLYLVSPIDIVPDFLLGVGQLDDFGVIAVIIFILAKLMVRFAPAAVVAEHLAAMGYGRAERAPATGSGSVIDASFRERRDHI